MFSSGFEFLGPVKGQAELVKEKSHAKAYQKPRDTRSTHGLKKEIPGKKTYA